MHISLNNFLGLAMKMKSFIEPNSHVKYRPDPSNPWSYFWIEINGNGLKKLCDHINFKSNNMHLKIQDFNQIINCFANIFNEELFISNQNSEFLRVTSEIMKILSFLIKEHGIKKNQSSLSNLLTYLFYLEDLF